MIERPDAQALMAGELGSWLSDQHHVRENARAASNKRFMFAIPALVLAGLAWFTFVSMVWNFRLFVFIAAAFFALAWAYKPRAEAVKRVKTGINQAIAQAVGLDYAEQREPGSGFDLARSFRMLPRHDRSNFEDFWSGEIAGHPFELFEAHLQERRQSGKNSHYVTVFRGAIMRFGFGTPFHGTTLLARDGEFRRFIFGARKDSVTLGGIELGFANLAHPDFEDVFDLYSSDQTEARYLVDPVYCERLIAIEEAFEGSDIRTLFHGGEVLVVVELENMFESGSLDSDHDRVLLERTCNQFGSLADLANALDKKKRA